MTMQKPLITHNAKPVVWADIPVLSVDAFRQTVIKGVKKGKRLLALTGMQSDSSGDGKGVKVLAVLADDAAGKLEMMTSCISGDYPAITPECPQAHHFERELFEQWGIRPLNHPWLKPVRFPPGEKQANIGQVDWFDIESEETHTVAVGPIHAGIIEPGHFHFSCHGEQVLHLEISLGYQHRGIERVLTGGPDARTIHYMETLAGDTTVGHSLAYCHAVEALSDMACAPRSVRLRAMALELERLANHVGNLGGMSGDVAFLPTASYCGGLRGDYLNLTAMLCGSRLGRGFIRPGGVSFDVDAATLSDMRQRLARLHQATKRAVDLLWASASVSARFEHVGMLMEADARELGMVGPVARASGVGIDVRHDHPLGDCRDETFSTIRTEHDERGDVLARARQRWLEIEQSHQMLEGWLAALEQNPDPVVQGSDHLQSDLGQSLHTNKLVVSLVEGWRGEICHIALTDANGHFLRYKIIDPSFHNWYGLMLVMRGQPILDFPVCNKSFDLSYCGHDL